MNLKILFCTLSILLATWVLESPHASGRNFAEEEKLILVGVGAYNDGFYDIAEKEFLNFIREYPKHERFFDICYLLGKTLYAKGKLKEARSIFSKILNENRPFEHTDYVLYWLAEIELKWGNPEGARKSLLQIINRFPKFDELDTVHYFLGLIESASNRFPQAESYFKRITLTSKNNSLVQSSFFWLGLLAYRQNRFEEATGYFKTPVQNPKSIPAHQIKFASLWLGQTLLKLDKFEEAKSTYKAIYDRMKQDAASVEINWKLGFCDYRLGHLKDAIGSFQSLKNQNNDSPLLLYTYYLLGRMFYYSRDYSSSIKELNPILTMFREHPLWGATFLSLFQNHIQQGDFPGANRVFQRLQKLNHFNEEKAFLQWVNAELTFSEGKIADSLPYYFNILNTQYREKALAQIGKGYYFENKFREAITNFDILLLEFPNSDQAVESLFMKGECLAQLGNWNHALETYEVIIAKDRKDQWELYALTQTGNLHASLNENERAEKVFKKIVDRFSNHPLSTHAAFRLGNLFFRQNNIGEAIHYYSLILKSHRVELWGETHFSLGEIFYQEGKYDKALDSFETALQYLQGNSPWFFLSQLEIGNIMRRFGKLDDAKKSYMVILNHTKDEEIQKAVMELLRLVDAH